MVCSAGQDFRFLADLLLDYFIIESIILRTPTVSVELSASWEKGGGADDESGNGSHGDSGDLLVVWWW